MKWKNQLTGILKIRYPVVQAPMLGVTTPGMVAEICRCEGLGSLPVGGLAPGKTRELIRATRELTNKPFAVNLFVNESADPDIKQVMEMQIFLEKLCAENNIPFEKKPVYSYNFFSYREQIDILLEEKVPVVSFTFGIPDKESIAAFKAAGVILIGTCTSLKEAKLLDENAVDIITAQGIEAGGHRGSFIADEPLPQVGLFSLVPQVVASINKPVLAAGGINDGKTIKAAFALGAQGVQVGTAFITSNESAAPPSYKNALLHASDTDSVLTKSFTGRWARGLQNTFITETERSGLQIPAYPVQLNLTSSIRSFAVQQDNKEFISLWSGQSPSKAQLKAAAAIFQELVMEAEQ